MIKTIMTRDGLEVTGGGTPWPSYFAGSGMNQGQVRYNASLTQLEVYDGQSWMPLYSTQVTVGLDYPTRNILTWAQKKMQEEQQILERAKTNPAVAAAVEDLRAAEERVRIVAALTHA